MNFELLGDIKDFITLPQEVFIKNEKYYLVKDRETYKLLSSVCPHQGGEIFLKEDSSCLECAIHKWRFDISTGNSLNVKQKKLKATEVIEKNEKLFAVLEETKSEEKNKHPLRDSSKFPTIKLHSHACLEINIEEFSLLCDPWLEGTAFLGSWTPYPAPSVRVSDLSPNAIWISHEHSDHFHIQTLSLFEKDIPIYVPDFPNQRMVNRLKELGFQQITAVPFGEPIKLEDNFTITTYEPDSLWNDAMILIEANNFRILNLNDSGINHRIAKEIGWVDVIASSFSPGASGYPLTWEHIQLEKKKEIMSSGKNGMLQMLKQAADIYNAQYILPFASYFTLWHEKHAEYIKVIEKNSPMDVVKFFSGTNYKVIDLLPGDIWEPKKDKIYYQDIDREVIFSKEYIGNYVKSIVTDFRNIHPLYQEKLTVNEMIEYFLRLNDVPEIVFCEDITVTVEALSESIQGKLVLSFEVKKGELNILKNVQETPNILIQVPHNILQFIIYENESWDEATIGYWCKFSRNPDVYHADFWRLLQAPYYKKNMQVKKDDNGSQIVNESNIAKVIEEHGKTVERVFNRYGLYCTGCQYAPYENIETAAKVHGISEEKLDRLVHELNRII